MFQRIRSRFRAVDCRYVDVDDPDIQEFPQMAAWLQSGKVSLPAVAVNGEVLAWGRFTSQQLLQEMGRRLGPGVMRGV